MVFEKQNSYVFQMNSTALVTYEQRYTTLRLCPRKCNGGRIIVRGGIMFMLIITQVLLTYRLSLDHPLKAALTRLSELWDD